jgi:quercetin dioxygenase-like cupin family protein
MYHNQTDGLDIMTERAGYFVPKDRALVEDTPRGPHAWLSSPAATASEHAMMVRVEMPVGRAHPFHYHPAMEEILYVLAGDCEQWIEDQCQRIGPGDVAHIPKGMVHGTYNVGNEPMVFLAVLSPAVFEGPATIDCCREQPWCDLKTPIEDAVMEGE